CPGHTSCISSCFAAFQDSFKAYLSFCFSPLAALGRVSGDLFILPDGVLFIVLGGVRVIVPGGVRVIVPGGDRVTILWLLRFIVLGGVRVMVPGGVRDDPASIPERESKLE
ncbi:unnamed protein product, partial [Owenia fusiformis]